MFALLLPFVLVCLQVCETIRPLYQESHDYCQLFSKPLPSVVNNTDCYKNLKDAFESGTSDGIKYDENCLKSFEIFWYCDMECKRRSKEYSIKIERISCDCPTSDAKSKYIDCECLPATTQAQSATVSSKRVHSEIFCQFEKICMKMPLLMQRCRLDWEKKIAGIRKPATAAPEVSFPDK